MRLNVAVSARLILRRVCQPRSIDRKGSYPLAGETALAPWDHRCLSPHSKPGRLNRKSGRTRTRPRHQRVASTALRALAPAP